jgi:hypothetical protein
LKAIDCIVEFTEYKEDQSLLDAVGFCNYYHWTQCSFLGIEDFDDIKEALSPEVKHIGDYFNFVLGIPKLKHFLSLEEMQSYNYAVVSFHMSLDCFYKFNSETWYLGDSMESKFDVDVLETVCVGHNTGVYIEQDAPQLESRMDEGVEEITVTVPAGELQWGYKDAGEPPSVEVEPNNGQDQEKEYFDALLHHNVPLEHDVIQDMYSYVQEKAGVGNPVNQEMFNKMSALQAIQYCTAKGFIFIHMDNELFIPFHELTVMVVNAIAEKFYSYKDAKDNP